MHGRPRIGDDVFANVQAVGYYWLHPDCGCQSFGNDPAYMGGKSPLLCHHQKNATLGLTKEGP